MKYLLDANVLMHWANEAEGYRLIVAKVEALAPKRRAISAITAFEVRRKMLEAKVSRDKVHALGRILAMFAVLPFTEYAATAAISLMRELRSRGISIGDPDTMQAGHALSLGRTFVTDNERHFRPVPGLSVENWRR